MHDATAPNIGQPMAIVFIEQKPIKQDDGTVLLRDERRLISVATIKARLGYRFRITGLTMREAQDLALLLRAGALAAPMRIVEERTWAPPSASRHRARHVLRRRGFPARAHLHADLLQGIRNGRGPGAVPEPGHSGRGDVAAGRDAHLARHRRHRAHRAWRWTPTC